MCRGLIILRLGVDMRVATGIEGFDELVQGGLVPNRVYVLSGPPGSGKTTFGVQFLAYGAMGGEPGLYLSLTEHPDSIIHDMSNYTFNVPALVQMKKLMFVDLGPELEYGFMDDISGVITPTYEQGVQSSAVSPEHEPPSPANVFKHIKNYVEQHGVKRLVIDSVSSIRFTASEHSLVEKEMSRFIRNVTRLGCTTIFLGEMVDPSAYTTEQFASNGVIFMHNFMHGRNMVRAIQVIKMRGTKHDCDMRMIEFTQNGLKVLGKVE